MPTITEHAQAYARAKAAGDNEAADFIHQQLVAAQQAQDKQDYNPTSGMSWMQRGWANLGAGMENAGLGAAQLVLPKAAEHALGITDDSINERRARDETLANSIEGGKLTQLLGEAMPYLAVPGGLAARAATAIPKLGAGLEAIGVGTRALPTVMADSAVLGGLAGAATPTTSDESAVARGLGGAATGAFLPGGLAALGKGASVALRPLVPSLQREALAGRVGESIATDPAAQRQLSRSVAASDKRVVDAPQSLATLTQDPALARLELAARANPDTAESWVNFDQNALNARWKALSDALGTDTTVQAAKAETNNFANLAIPELFKNVNSKKLADSVQDFSTAVQGRLTSAVKNADPARQQVYGYVKQALDQGGGSPQMLWNIRKTLSEWLEGTPPPGMEGTRGAKMDAPIMETRKAIDNVLNRVTNKKWSRFLEDYGEYARRESEQKAGQNIRNMFFDETLGTARGPTTSQGNPAVTRARLEQALVKFGKNDFGDALNYQQRNVIDQVLADLRADEILQRVKSSMTGKGGSQTAPLEALMKSTARGLPGGGWLTPVADLIGGLNQRGQQRMLNTILQSPEDAVTIMRQAEDLKRPLSRSEQRVVQAARAVLASPSALVLMNKPTDQPSQ